MSFDILFASLLNGITTGAIYALVALGLTLIYGVLHIINFAHGAALMAALYGVYFLNVKLGLDPYVALPVMVPVMFAAGYALQRYVIGTASHGKDENILLVTLGLAIVLENLALFLFRSDTRTVDTPYTFSTVDILGAFIAVLVITSQWRSAYPTAAHEKRGKEVGLPAESVEAIVAGRPTLFADAREQTVYEASLALAQARLAPQDLYDRAVEILGHESITDMIVLMGYYTAVSLTMNFYAVPPGSAGLAR